MLDPSPTHTLSPSSPSKANVGAKRARAPRPLSLRRSQSNLGAVAAAPSGHAMNQRRCLGLAIRRYDRRKRRVNQEESRIEQYGSTIHPSKKLRNILDGIMDCSADG